MTIPYIYTYRKQQLGKEEADAETDRREIHQYGGVKRRYRNLGHEKNDGQHERKQLRREKKKEKKNGRKHE